VTTSGDRTSTTRRVGRTLLLSLVVVLVAPIVALVLVWTSLYALQLTAELVTELNR
jgi:hypothetical protein